MTWNERKSELGRELVLSLFQAGMIKTWFRHKPEGWRLVSGLWSPLYIQLRDLSSYPRVLKLACEALSELLTNELPAVNRLVGVAMAGIPLAVGVSLTTSIPTAFTRKLEGLRQVEELERNIAAYGEHGLIEGVIAHGDRIAVIDDLVTKFTSKLIAIQQLNHEIERRNLNEVHIESVVVLFDREQGAKQEADRTGHNLHSLIPFKSRGVEWLGSELHHEEIEVMSEYLDNPTTFQTIEMQERLRQMAQAAND